MRDLNSISFPFYKSHHLSNTGIHVRLIVPNEMIIFSFTYPWLQYVSNFRRSNKDEQNIRNFEKSLSISSFRDIPIEQNGNEKTELNNFLAKFSRFSDSNHARGRMLESCFYPVHMFSWHLSTWFNFFIINRSLHPYWCLLHFSRNITFI